jgi:hypothetical protein
MDGVDGWNHVKALWKKNLLKSNPADRSIAIFRIWLTRFSSQIYKMAFFTKLWTKALLTINVKTNFISRSTAQEKINLLM